MNEAQTLAAIRATGALISDGHFVYTSGAHGDTYFNKDAVFMHTELTAQLCEQIARHFVHQAVDIVIGPVAGGVIMGQWVAYNLSKLQDREVLAIYADKAKGSTDQAPRFIVKRGYDKAIAHKRVLIVDDVLNMGTSIRAMRDLVAQHDGKLVGAGCLINRYSHDAHSLQIPELYNLIKLKLHIYDAKACSLCKKGVPINTDYGKAKAATS